MDTIHSCQQYRDFDERNIFGIDAEWILNGFHDTGVVKNVHIIFHIISHTTSLKHDVKQKAERREKEIKANTALLCFHV